LVKEGVLVLTIDLSQLVGLSGIPFVTALVELVKQTLPTLDNRYSPGLSFGMGILWNLAIALILGTDLRVALAVGLVTGLSASGLYTWVRVRPVAPV
jgi:hypothetical protein